MSTGRYFTHSDGSLFRFDDRDRRTMSGKTIRENFAVHHRTIETTADLKATLRAGPYAWPGGYPLYFITSDGGAVSFAAVRENLREELQFIRLGHHCRVVACEINYEDYDLYCDHTGERIECAYGED